jgi:two-component system, sensor histidine kinase RegB
MFSRLRAPRQDPQQNVRLDTIVGLRWLAVIGQTAAVGVVHFGLDFMLPLWPILSVIALSAWLNVALSLHDRMSRRIGPRHAAWLLAFDIAQLAVLLYLTGGLQNPFAFLFLGPVIISAMALPPRYTLMLGAFAVACATVLVFVHMPLPWADDDPLLLPPLYTVGIWLSILLALIYIGVYAWQIAEGARRLSDALAATELVLAREQHLSQLDGLAAAAAHELATPLSTISVVAKELERALGPSSPHAEDVHLLREQARRCREILGKLTELSADQPFDRAPVSVLIDEVVLPHRNFGIEIDTVLPMERAAEPIGRRTPAVLYGLGNLVENAVDFARERVEVAVRWSPREVAVTIADDGPGFAAEVIDRLGEPYLTTRGARRRLAASDEPTGLGLGFFIAKTLLERSGATLAFANRKAPEHGAVVSVRWERANFEPPASDRASAWGMAASEPAS